MPSILEIVLSLLFVSITGAFFHHYFILRNGPNEPPLVKGPIPLLGCGLSLGRDMKSFLIENRVKYGGIYTLYVLGKRIHIISDPVEGVPFYFRSKNFELEEFANTLRKKLFLNSEEELKNHAMTQDLS